MFDQKNRGKIKNTKIMVWRLELEQLKYSISHRPGKDNVAPDAMSRISRICSSMFSVSQLRLLHDQLGHPGFARMYNFIRSRNLPYTSEETKDIIDKCRTCLRLKRIFLTPHRNLLRRLGHGNVCRSTSRGLSMVRNLIFSSPYHPTGNSKGERVNQIIWKTIKLLLHSRTWPEESWEDVLSEALYSVRTLLCNANNETPHERMFRFQRQAKFGCAMPTWPLSEGSVLLRRHVRSKSDPLCDEVLLLEANPSYAHITYTNGREATLSTSDLAPCPGIGIELSTPPVSTPEGESPETSCDVRLPTEPDTATRQLVHARVPPSEEP